MADKPKKVYVRDTTVGEDLKDIAKGIGRSVGGMLGNARDAIQQRPAHIDDAVDQATSPALSQYEAQSSDRHNGY